MKQDDEAFSNDPTSIMAVSDFLSESRSHLSFGTTDNLTPKPLANRMVRGVLEDFSDEQLPHVRILDPVCGTGIFLACSFDFLFSRLERQFPNPFKRAQHIYEKQLFGFDSSSVKTQLTRRFLDPRGTFDLNLHTLDFLKEDITMEFDAVVGNPPYNDASGSMIYDEFVFKANGIADRTSFVIPARWTVTGRGTKRLREAVLNRELPAKSVDFISEKESGFTGVRVSGGYCILHLESGFDGDLLVNGQPVDTSRVDLIPRDSDHLEAVNQIIENGESFLNEKYIPSGWSGIASNLTFSGGENQDVVCFDSPEGLEDPVRIFASKKQGFEKWVEAGNTRQQGGGFHKVVTAAANGGYLGFGNLFTAEPKETFTQSYIAFRCDSEEEAHNLCAYLKTDFVEFFLSMRKASKNISRVTIKWIPLPDLTREWTNEMLKSENPFDLTQEALDIIYKSSEG